MEENKLICFLLDTSSSMIFISSKMRNAINNLLTEQKNTATNTSKCVNYEIRTFSTTNKFNIQVPITSIEYVKYLEDYKCDGMTALNDAIAWTIKAHDKKKNLMIVIVTDGEENSSIIYNNKTGGNIKIKSMIKEKETLGWNFLYLSSGFSKQGENLGCLTNSNILTRAKTQNYNSNYIDLPIKLERAVSDQISNYLVDGNMKGDDNIDFNNVLPPIPLLKRN